MNVRSILGLVVVAATVAVGCADASEPAPHESAVANGPATDSGMKDADGNPILFTSEAVSANQHFADTVTVADDHLTLPTKGNEATIAKLHVGSILAGNRSSAVLADDADPATNPNPYGFLVRVKSIKTVGANTVLTTEDAELSDWLAYGNLDFEDPTSLLGADNVAKSELSTKTLHLQDDGDLDKAGGKKDEGTSTGKGTRMMNNARIGDPGLTITLTSAHMSMGTHVYGKFKWHKPGVDLGPFSVHSPVPDGVTLGMHATLDPELVATWNIDFSREAALMKKGWKAPRVDIPLAGPLPLTVSFEPEWQCSLSATGSIKGNARTTVTGHLDFGFELSGALTSLPIPHPTAADPQFHVAVDQVGFKGTASATAECKVVANVNLHLFKVITLGGGVGPYVHLGVEGCDKGIEVTDSYGFQAQLSGGIEIGLPGPIPDAKFKVSILSKEVQIGGTNTLYGAGTCSGTSKSTEADLVDSCAGKRDGFYCSTVNDYAGYYCQDEQIWNGNQCDMDQKCTGGSKDDIKCASK